MSVFAATPPERAIRETDLLPPRWIRRPEPALIELRAQPDQVVGDPFLDQPPGFDQAAIARSLAADLASQFDLFEIPPWTPRYDNAPMQEVLALLGEYVVALLVSSVGAGGKLAGTSGD